MNTRTTKDSALFALASVSIVCLLAEMYQLTTMTFAVCAWLIPAAFALTIWLGWALKKGDRETVTVIAGGALFGFVAAIVYDVYRIPFALSGFPIFSVFPKFGRMIMGNDAPAWAVYAAGWAYHFSNGMGFGVMYMALGRRASPLWAVAFAVFIEVCMLLSPYPKTFGFAVTTTFLAITLSAHAIFGAAIGLQVRQWKRLAHA